MQPSINGRSSPLIPLLPHSHLQNPSLSLSLPIADLKINLVCPSNPTADDHHLLQQYGLPKGLLPNDVKSYSISAAGDFSLELASPCYVQFDQLVSYDRVIKGKRSYGGVHGASGILAKKLLLWVSVTAIELGRDSG